VQFFSYFRDLTGCAETEFDLPHGSVLQAAIESVFRTFPELRGAEKSVLAAVGLEYVSRDSVLHEGDVVSLFPPVQGG
jgi:molybdopterin converting factor small subunit